MPFLNDPDVWLLTLDKDGCWNGNCNQYIVITGDTSSTTDAQEPISKGLPRIYPNPASGAITIEAAAGAALTGSKVQVSDMNGTVRLRYVVGAPKSMLNLNHLPNGTYIVTVFQDEKPASTHKIIVQH